MNYVRCYPTTHVSDTSRHFSIIKMLIFFGTYALLPGEQTQYIAIGVHSNNKSNQLPKKVIQDDKY